MDIARRHAELAADQAHDDGVVKQLERERDLDAANLADLQREMGAMQRERPLIRSSDTTAVRDFARRYQALQAKIAGVLAHRAALAAQCERLAAGLHARLLECRLLTSHLVRVDELDRSIRVMKLGGRVLEQAAALCAKVGTDTKLELAAFILENSCVTEEGELFSREAVGQLMESLTIGAIRALVAASLLPAGQLLDTLTIDAIKSLSPSSSTER